MATPNSSAYVMSFRVTCYMFTILPPIYFHMFISHFLLTSTGMVGSFATSPVSLQFPLPDVVIATNDMPTHWAFYFQGSGLHFWLVVLGQVHCVGLILPCRSSRPLPWCCIGWHSTYLVRWLLCIWITALLRLICVIKVVQCLCFFPGWPARYWIWPTKHGITLIPAYPPNHLNVEADYLFQDWLLPV